ncbi:MAG: tannase/feruloyl esterase family alpha/beta hydrolase [Proteobacteria bacterium]|nr:tannase/feruloyl esterase family alpha/beta hydrolase [Pseudomonadota bacterium]
MRIRLFLTVTALLLSDPAFAAKDCRDVAGFILPDVQILTTEQIAEPVPHCKVVGVIGPEINFELLLPEVWNGKFLMGGGGGFVGSVQNSALRFTNPLERGYATVGTDTGHKGAGVDASWALNNLERLVNFGHVAVHRTAEVSKAITHLYYGKPVDRSYFFGCSRGGGQALMEAQRYPADFDGIIAGAPAFNWSGIAAQGLQTQQRMYPDPQNISRSVVTQENLKLLQSEILKSCDSLDGLPDGILNDPRECNFDLNNIAACAENVPAANCLTDAQRSAISIVYDGPKDATGKQIIAGFPFGGEAEAGGWVPWIVGGPAPIAPGVPTLQAGFSNGIFKYFIHQDPDWKYTEQEFADYEQTSRLMGSVLNATSQDLSAFNDRGGKLLMWHGWADPALSALVSTEYYEAVTRADAQAPDYFRFFLLPGVLHCGGGPGPSTVDYLTALEEWVEKDQAPSTLTAYFPDTKGSARESRPLCAYPERATWSGSGSDRVAANFACTR